MEKLLYELRPYFFASIGVIAVLAHTHRLMVISGLVLIMASMFIIKSRRQHRAWMSS